MSQCLHCSRPCGEDALFCEQCQAQAGDVFEMEIPASATLPAELSPATLDTLTAWDEAHWEQARPVVTPFEPSDIPVEDSQNAPLLTGGDSTLSDQAVSRLSAAARWIAEEEHGEKRLARSRSARLKPLRDISSEIQRASTPHPRMMLRPTFETQPEIGAGPKQRKTAQSSQLNPLSWFNGADAGEDEKESDLWAHTADPFVLRRRPTAAEAASIEEADIRRIEIEEHATLPYHSLRRRRRLPFWQVAFGIMVILAVVALAVDGLLLSAAFRHARRPLAAAGGPPTLILSTNVTNVGETVSMQLAHFTPTTTVALTHDVQETLETTSASSTLTIDANGQASTSFAVTGSWTPGFHLVVAEDEATRDTASAMLQISGEGPSRPPHLLLASASLTLGSAVQGADTIQPLVLRNAGSGSISWAASSDQPWLLVAPQQGTFSTGQTISVAAQRNALPPGEYNGTLTIFSNVGAPEQLHVAMTVSPLPLNAGPMISLVPPLLSFTTMDGSSTPETQLVTLSNPGQQELRWSLTSGNTVSTTMQSASPSFMASPWLNAAPASGSLAPGQTERIRLTAHSQALLPGAYMESLTFSSSQGTQVYDDPQVVDIALTVQPHCGLLTSSGSLEFTAVVGQSNPSNHALDLNATSSCANEPLNWHAVSPNNWITMSPASGQVKGTSSSVTSIGVNIANLKPGRYKGLVTFQAGQSTQTVMVQLNLQPRPAPLEPILGASPLSLNFSNVQGQANPAGQVVTITNNGGSPLKWRASIALLSGSWINTVPNGGTVEPEATGQLTINVSTSSLTPGNYTGQVTLSATDSRGSPASGAPQTITISLVVQPPCTLAQPSASTLLFSGIAGGANPVSQTITLAGAGSCAWPLHWSASASPAASWLVLGPASGTLNAASQQGSMTVDANTAGLQPGTYNTQVSINASDATGAQAKSSPQMFAVTLTVLQPCTLQPLPSRFTLSASQGQSATQAFSLSETGSCGGGVAWTALGDSGSSTWLNLSATSGTDTGSGSTITIGAVSSTLSPGVYNGQITISASNNGVVLQGSPQTIPVTFQVTGYTVSGSVLACAGPAPDCTISQGLAGASVSLISNGTTIETTTADASGNFSFANIPLGSYTISVTGISGATSYTGTASVTVNGNTSIPTPVLTFSSS